MRWKWFAGDNPDPIGPFRDRPPRRPAADAPTMSSGVAGTQTTSAQERRARLNSRQAAWWRTR